MTDKAQAPIPAKHPLMIAWKAWLASEDGRNAQKWGSAISVSIIDNQSTVGHPHLDGALWGAFVAGFQVGSSPQCAKCEGSGETGHTHFDGTQYSDRNPPCVACGGTGFQTTDGANDAPRR